MRTELSCVICVIDVNITELLDQALADLALPGVFVQRAKQMSLIDKRGFLGLHPITKLDESRALIYRFYVPSRFEQGAMQRVADATDLKMGGRGCIFAQRIIQWTGTPLEFDEEKLETLCGLNSRLAPEGYALICCTVPRGWGDSLSNAVLELGVCVPVIFFGSGMGLRDKLGLLRITVPVEKEIIWYLVPRSEAELVEKTIIPRAHLDVPGHGFLYKIAVHAPVVNLRVRQGKRLHAATMEQVIAALDEVRGSSDWRRIGARISDALGAGKHKTGITKGLFFIGEEEEVELFRQTAMDNGAKGATMNHLEMRSYRAVKGEQPMESHSREFCDIIIPASIEEAIFSSMEKTGLFDEGRTCMMKILPVEMPSTIRRRSP